MTESKPLGREVEVAVLSDILNLGRSGLYLVVGRHRAGKGQILASAAALAAERGYPTPGVSRSEATGWTWLTVGRDTTPETFEGLVASPSTNDEDWSATPQVVLIYGYRAGVGFHQWFTQSFLARPSQAIVIVAGESEDLVGLAQYAECTIELGPLSASDVAPELQRLSMSLDEPLTETELAVYGAAIAASPGLFEVFGRVLPLTFAEALVEEYK